MRRNSALLSQRSYILDPKLAGLYVCVQQTGPSGYRAGTSTPTCSRRFALHRRISGLSSLGETSRPLDACEYASEGGYDWIHGVRRTRCPWGKCGRPKVGCSAEKRNPSRAPPRRARAIFGAEQRPGRIVDPASPARQSVWRPPNASTTSPMKCSDNMLDSHCRDAVSIQFSYNFYLLCISHWAQMEEPDRGPRQFVAATCLAPPNLTSTLDQTQQAAACLVG